MRVEMLQYQLQHLCGKQTSENLQSPTATPRYTSPSGTSILTKLAETTFAFDFHPVLLFFSF